MTTVAQMLTDEKRQALLDVAAQQNEASVANTLLAREVVTQEQRDAQVRAQLSQYAVIIPRGEGRMLATCPCGEEIEIDLDVPEEVAAKPRVPLCAECASKHMRGRSGQIIHRPRVAKHQPRLSDNQIHPVTVTHIKEQQPVKKIINLDTMSDAEVGAAVKEQARTKKAKDLPAKRAKAVKVEKAKDKKAKADKAADRASRVVLPEIVVSATLTVPALDLTDVASMQEVASATMRSPYNKARFGGGIGPKETLPKDMTYADLEAEHRRIQEAMGAKPAKAEKKKAGKKKLAGTPRIAAHVPMNDDAKIKTLMGMFEVSEKKARKMLAEIS